MAQAYQLSQLSYFSLNKTQWLRMLIIHIETTYSSKPELKQNIKLSLTEHLQANCRDLFTRLETEH